MEREKLLKYRGLAPIRFLNDLNAGLLSAEEYKLVREINKNNAWDELDGYIERADQVDQLTQEENLAPIIKEKEKPSLKASQNVELRTNIRIEKNFYAIPNDVIDVLAPLQTPAEEVVYRRLIRMSYGWRRNHCRTSIPYLLKTSQIKSENTVRKALRGLIEKGHIAEYVNEKGRVDTNNDGTLYIVFLPDDIHSLSFEEGTFGGDAKNEPPSKNEVGAKNNSPSKIIPLQKMNPKGETLENTEFPQGGAKFEGAKFEGDIKFTGAKNEPPPPQELQVQNLNPPAKSPENTEFSQGGAKFEGAKFEPIKDNNKHINKNTLSPRAIISNFYEQIGQQKISAAKRERAEKNLEEMLKDGFTTEDIQFAVEWTLKSTKKELYDFSIVKHTIGQAIAAKNKSEAEETKKLEAKKEAEKVTIEKHKEEKQIAEEMARIKAYKENLTANEKIKLREMAEKEIKNSGQYKKEFITEYLIEAKENELIRSQIDI